MLITKDRNGYGNDSHCVFLTNALEPWVSEPDSFSGSSAGSSHMCYITGNTLSNVQKDADGVFDSTCWAITGYTQDEWANIKCDDNESDWDFGKGNFCIDFWLKSIMIGTEGVFGSNGVYNSSLSGGNYFGFVYDNGYLTSETGLTFLVRKDGVDDILLQSGVTISSKVWMHIAVTRNVDTFRFFVNGNMVDSQVSISYIMPDWGSTSNKPYIIGDIFDRNEFKDIGYYYSMSAKYDEFRITKGDSRWTRNFTVPNRHY